MIPSPTPDPLSEEEYLELTAALSEAQQDRDQGYLGTNPAGPMVTDTIMEMISGKDEIPERWKEIVPHLVAICQQYMPIYGLKDLKFWRRMARHSLNMYLLEHPYCHITQYDRTQILYLTSILLTKALGGFERDRTISTITTIAHQQNSVRMPIGSENRQPLTWFQRAKNALGGRRR